MDGTGEDSAAVAARLGAVDELAEPAARAGFSAAQLQFTRATALHLARRVAWEIPEAFARSGRLSRSEAHDLVERSIRADLATRQGMTERMVTRNLELAQLLFEDLPLTRAALSEGRLLWEAIEAICDAAATLPVTARGALDERAVDVALTKNLTQLRRAVARMRDELHDEPLAVRHVRARQDRGVGSPRRSTAWRRCARCCPHLWRWARTTASIASPARSATATATATETETNAPATSARSPSCAPTRSRTCSATATSPARPRSTTARPPRRRSCPERADVRPTLAASTATGADDTPAHLDGYGLIPADTARELVGVGASFTRILTDPDTGFVASVGRTHRVPPHRMRLHLQLRDQTCRFPGCTRPASTSEADHTLEWRNGGETALENLASLCTAHHHVRHGDRWTYRLHPDGTTEWTTPTGRRVTTRPAALPGRPPAPPPRPRFDDAPPPF
ncbi:DUF222 domain-containing protein [Rathayibacter oskolensis]|uniref:HNH endonuclease signature motif containing protein n=1 Tax=Rathayibacter oskolensis TaxID=1891671 RepID=UPI00265E39E5|nr:HNH endonuclease signature motif containing protein [Rathayibacter oskolensis]WKK71772.1 DUF222 domain-containing protein [Rathayibacter oskolensis]